MKLLNLAIIGGIGWAIFSGLKKNNLGDLNDDGVVDELDLEILAYYIAVGHDYLVYTGKTKLSEEEFLKRADVNKDGIVDSRDVSALEALILSKPIEPIVPTGDKLTTTYVEKAEVGWVAIENGYTIGQMHGIGFTQSASSQSTFPDYWDIKARITAPNGQVEQLSPYNYDVSATRQHVNVAYYAYYAIAGQGTYRLDFELFIDGQVVDTKSVNLNCR